MAQLTNWDDTEKFGGEFSWGPGMMENRARGSGLPSSPGNPGGDRGLTAFEQLQATRMTDTDNPDANEDDVYNVDVSASGVNEDGTYKPGTLRSSVTKRVTQDPVLPTAGQHARLDASKYNPDHEADGYQDGSGAAWRASVPPNPVRHD